MSTPSGYNACILSIYAARNWAVKTKQMYPSLGPDVLIHLCEHTLPGLFAWGPGDNVRPRPGVDKYGP